MDIIEPVGKGEFGGDVVQETVDIVRGGLSWKF
jgi:hypothetical protein